MSDEEEEEVQEYICPECGEEIEADDEGEDGEGDDDGSLFCENCGHELTREAQKEQILSRTWKNIVVAVVKEVEVMKGGKLKAVQVDIGEAAGAAAAAGAETSLVTVVTNTKHVEEGEIVVVALPGATVPVSKTVEEGATVVEKSSVGGRKSGGMLCDSYMLGWDGNKGTAVKLDADGGFEPGQRPPVEKQRT